MEKWTQRLVLAALLLLVGAVQARFTWVTLVYVVDPGSLPRPPLDLDIGELKLTQVRDNAAKAGAKTGDVLLAVNGQPVQSYIDAMGSFMRSKPGDKVTLGLRRGELDRVNASFALEPLEHENWQSIVIPLALTVVTPWSCIALGFLVAFRRPGDVVARSLLALLLCISQMMTANGFLLFGSGPLLTGPAIFLTAFADRAWRVAWLWFAVLFPDPESRFKVLPWTRWALGLPYALEGFLHALAAAVLFHRPGAMGALESIGRVPNWLVLGWGTALFALGFANLAYKLARETRPAMRRRLKWLAAGLATGLAPFTAIVLSSAISGRDLNNYPAVILLPAIFTPVLVPLTLGYAVLVDRIFDVGVFIRQGLLASRTVAVAKAVLIALSVWAGVTAAAERRWAAAALYAAAILLVIRGSARLRQWVDRKFFREAVNAEHLLVELSGEVRRITNPQELLRMVTERVAAALHVRGVAALTREDGRFVVAWATAYEGGIGAPELTLQDPRVIRLRQDRRAVEGAELLLPLSVNDDLSGILSLGPKRSEEPYTKQDIRLLESVASQTALALENSRLTATVAEEAAQRERINSELEIARAVQQRLFPKCAPRVNGLELAAACRPAQTVGGDYYDFLAAPSGEVGLVIGDVAGKGIPAALLMAALQASVRGLTVAGIADLGVLMGMLNGLVYDATPANRFATLLYGLYQPASRVIRYSTAGHNPALLWRAGTSRAEWLKTPGVGLGLTRSSRHEQAEVVLGIGDCLILYTDGVTEARNEQQDEFGDDRLVDTVRKSAEKSAAEILDELMKAVTAFAASAPQHDDITLIVARAV